jgi:hypothetical protein
MKPRAFSREVLPASEFSPIFRENILCATPILIICRKSPEKYLTTRIFPAYCSFSKMNPVLNGLVQNYQGRRHASWRLARLRLSVNIQACASPAGKLSSGVENG